MPVDRLDEPWEEIKQAIQEMASEGGVQEWEAFRDWAFREIFLSEALADSISDIDARNYTRIDGSDDLEIDGYILKDDERHVYLFQSKHKQRYTLRDLDKFLDAPKNVLDSRLVADCKNSEVKYLHGELRERLQQGYSLRLVAVTSGHFDKRARIRLQGLADEESLLLRVDGKDIRVPVAVESYDREGLSSLLLNHKAERRPAVPEVVLTLVGYHEFAPGGYKTLIAHVPAKDIVEAFRTYEYSLFDQNPRLWLGTRARPYLKMAEALRDREQKRVFHILNNGLSALCDSYAPPSVDTATGRMKARFHNFQIVNGCQTTVFLARNRNLLDDEVYVTIRVTETVAPWLGKKIAETTNTQTGLRAEQFRANDTEQGELKKEFEHLSPPWFYEIKTGSWAYDTPDKRSYKENGTFRHLTIKDVAQAALAFVGMPGEAMEDTRTIFERKEDPTDTKRHYEDAFPQGITAQQLLLPALTQRKVALRVRGLDRIGREPYDYGELHLLWMLGVLLWECYKVEQSGFLPPDLSKQLCQTLDDWFDSLFEIAAETLVDCVDDAKREAEKATARFDQRNFYRSRRGTANYQMIRNWLTRTIQKKRIRGDPFSHLPKW